jgi:hypothetical protein
MKDDTERKEEEEKKLVGENKEMKNGGEKDDKMHKKVM